VPGLTWVAADDVARPDEAFTGGSAPTTGPAGPGTAGHPGHFPGQAIVDDVVAVPAGGLVAVGYVGVRGVWTAISWHSSDGRSWTLDPIDRTPGTLAVSVTAGTDATGGAQVVAAGIAGREPAAWTSHDGRTWLRHPVPTLSTGTEAERIAVIAGVDGGYLAGGSVGPELGERHARFWRSADGTTWVPVADDPGLEGAEVVAIAQAGSGYVALGRLGSGQRGTGSVAWTSPDGRGWSRVAAASLANGLVAGLAQAPDGGLVAVGSDLDEREALAWRSTDGHAWEAAPREPSRIYNDGDKIRMTDVVAVPDGLVAVGNFVTVQFGTATSWISPDGRSWRRASPDAVLQQGEMLAVARGGPGLVAVGSFGAPDNYIPTIWLSELASGG
jgi:hypothetical protein